MSCFSLESQVVVYMTREVTHPQLARMAAVSALLSWAEAPPAANARAIAALDNFMVLGFAAVLG